MCYYKNILVGLCVQSPASRLQYSAEPNQNPEFSNSLVILL